MTTRGFQLVSKFENTKLIPERVTDHSAGYDFKAAETVTIAPGTITLVSTGVKAFMGDNEVLYLYDRSSNPRKLGLVLINSVGVIDKDYFNNPGNEGEIFAQFMNITDKPVTITEGTRICQGVFMNFLTTDDDTSHGTRVGGFGSTGD